jgi:glycogen operon protein
MRDFWRGQDRTLRDFATRFAGSPDLFAGARRRPTASVNLITVHDGFTMRDLVSYGNKHNEANGEHNRDGGDDNRSWNCGIEGPADDPAVERLRNRQVKNLLTVTMLSIGLPMIVMGDEVRRTQGGNNNAYCQDNETSWFDWRLVAQHADVHRFVTLLNARRALRDVEHERERVTLTELIGRANKSWHGVKIGQPDWGDDSHSIAFTVELRRERMFAHIILNAYWEPLEFELPPVADDAGGHWRRWIDTARESPRDIVPWQTAPSVPTQTYRVEAHSVVFLFAATAPRESRPCRGAPSGVRSPSY